MRKPPYMRVLTLLGALHSFPLYAQEKSSEFIFNLSLEDLMNIEVSVASNVISDIRKPTSAGV